MGRCCCLAPVNGAEMGREGQHGTVRCWVASAVLAGWQGSGLRSRTTNPVKLCCPFLPICIAPACLHARQRVRGHTCCSGGGQRHRPALPKLSASVSGCSGCRSPARSGPAGNSSLRLPSRQAATRRPGQVPVPARAAAAAGSQLPTAGGAAASAAAPAAAAVAAASAVEASAEAASVASATAGVLAWLLLAGCCWSSCTAGPPLSSASCCCEASG